MSICNSRGLAGLMFNLFLHNLSVPTLKTVFFPVTESLDISLRNGYNNRKEIYDYTFVNGGAI